MKIKVLIPSEEYKNYAGARIRYGRLGAELERRGITLVLEDIAEFAVEKDDSDALLISKCHDARALVAAAGVCARGQLVGVDLFDDYFSQCSDSRLVRYRAWLKQLLTTSHFVLSSTAALARALEASLGGLPVHVVNDPAPVVNVAELAEVLGGKLANTRNQLTLRIAWFGVGDNPYFRVGLSDLAAYGGSLRRLGSCGLDIELTILTNDRALTADGLALVGRLPLRTRVERWTEDREREVLAEAFACFLPVNAQRFSAAKSLNRAVTALSAGCQIISVGYPLYEALRDFIYSDVDSFLSDFARGSMRHSAANISNYETAIEANASPAAEAAALAEFLGRLKPADSRDVSPLALVHGHAANGAAHKMARALGGFSVASPYCAAELGFDIIFKPVRNGLAMLVSEHAAKRVLTSLRPSLRYFKGISDRRFLVVPETDTEDEDFLGECVEWHRAALGFQIATYEQTMARIGERMKATFGPCRIFISESSGIPFGFGL